MNERTGKGEDSREGGSESAATTSPDRPLDENGFPIPHTGENGRPVYDQNYFLALARLGKDVWNRWRAAYQRDPKVPSWHKDPNYISVTFAGVDFREPANARIDFSGFDFGDGATFFRCQFRDGNALAPHTFMRGMAKFTGAIFGNSVDFSDAIFGNEANLSGATFGDEANLSGAIFGDWANLSGAIFGIRAVLSGATFGNEANLSGATFGNEANLSGATFGNEANLSGAIFGDWANLSGATFGDYTQFTGWSEEKWRASQLEMIERSAAMKAWSGYRKDAFSNIPEYLRKKKAGPDSFLELSFSGARFKGRARFSSRKFLGDADFTQVKFVKPPRFADCIGFDRIDFTGAHVSFGSELFLSKRLFGRAVQLTGWTTKSDIAVQSRRLRKLAEETKNHDFERDLYIEERKAERGIFFMQFWQEGWKGRLSARMLAHCLWIVVMFVYSLLADYGRSFVRPAIALVFSVFVFHWAYTAVLPAPHGNATRAFDRALWAFSVSNAVPFVGALTLERDVKLTLLCGDAPVSAEDARLKNQPVCTPIPGRRYQFFVLAQSVFSALCVFFIALALRNYFKLR